MRRDPEQRRLLLTLAAGILGTAGVQVVIAWGLAHWLFSCSQ